MEAAGILCIIGVWWEGGSDREVRLCVCERVRVLLLLPPFGPMRIFFAAEQRRTAKAAEAEVQVKWSNADAEAQGAEGSRQT